MGRVIEVRRHTHNDGDVLTDEGVQAAVALGRSLAEASWNLVVSTGAQRATQTAACILAGAGATVQHGVVVEPGLRSQVEDRWRAAYRDAGSGHLDDLSRADPDLVASERDVLGAALRRVVERLGPDERALVIGHSPTNEAAVLGLTGNTVEPLGKGQGVVLTETNDGWDVRPAP